MRTMKEADETREYRMRVKEAEERSALAHPAVAARLTALEAEVERLTEVARLAGMQADQSTCAADEALAEVERLQAERMDFVRANAELAAMVPDPDDLRVTLWHAANGIPYPPGDLDAIGRVRATLPGEEGTK